MPSAAVCSHIRKHYLGIGSRDNSGVCVVGGKGGGCVQNAVKGWHMRTKGLSSPCSLRSPANLVLDPVFMCAANRTADCW